LQLCSYGHEPRSLADTERSSFIDSFKHASVDEVLQHWKQFLEQVTGALIQVEQEAQDERLRCLAAGGQWPAEDYQQQAAGKLPSAAETVSSICRWCSCCYDEAGLTIPLCPGDGATADAAFPVDATDEDSAMFMQGVELAGGVAPSAASCSSRAVPSASSASALPGVPCCPRQPSASELKIMQLVNKYSCETKFVALLNPGEPC